MVFVVIICHDVVSLLKEIWMDLDGVPGNGLEDRS
jgi:hypothetical protein